MIEKENYFEKLSKINVNEYAEKKGRFTYLSWAWAVDVLRKNEPTATWEIVRFNGLPFLQTECGFFVEVAVTVRGVTLSQLHPVIDNYNKPIAKPTSFQINTSIQRALVKAIALHGIGLYIYAGEDLPDDGEDNEQVSNIKKLANAIDGDIDEVRKKKNEDSFEIIKAELLSCDSIESLDLVKSENLKELNALNKYAPELFAELLSIKERQLEKISK